ncbi:PRC-barrel domain-containing protein [Phenylobacterium sp.]|uniref:PRC-barrel domain-containing protein n=1 Tax=Phenylobacterium sp. TaxID=1871053 RepID=UPI003569B9B2
MRNIDEWLAPQDGKGGNPAGSDRRSRAEGRGLPVLPGGRTGPARRARAGHFLITGTRVIGASVFGINDERLGRVLDVSIEKASGQIHYVLLAVGGFLGFGGRVHPLPWSDFKYETGRGGYRLPFDRPQIAAMTGLGHDELEWCGAGDRAQREREAYSNVYVGHPFY